MFTSPASGPAAAVSDELEAFEREARRFLEGAIPNEVFRPFRLMYGIYGQRQAGRHMVRVKIPHGSLRADQLEALAEIVERFAPRKVAHVTTRQDIQIHFVMLEDVPTVLRALAAAGLTTREACGNTVRNVTADETSGLCPDTVFDVTPHAEAVARFFLRHPLTQRLPRKFKISFSACPHDHGLIPIHDLGAMAVLRDGRRGFQVSVGGGLGGVPRLARPFREFVPEEELLPTFEAILRVFDRLGERKNRNKARLKFLVERLGIDEFRRLVVDELASLPAADSGAYPRPDWALLEERPSHPSAVASLGPHAPEAGFGEWKATNAVRQRQEGFYLAYVLLPIGDLTAAQIRALAGIARRYAGGRIRATRTQNMALRWVHEEDLSALHADLAAAGLAEPGAHTIRDVTACPGADTCGVGITTSKALARALGEHLAASDGLLTDPLVGQIRIKVDGCMDACGQHHIADIGLYGCAVHRDGRLVPTYQLLVAGLGSGEGARLAQPVMKIAARRVPTAVGELLRTYLGERRAGEPFGDYALRVGTAHLREALAGFQEMPAFNEDPTAYVDLGTTKLFSLEERGEGECAT